MTPYHSSLTILSQADRRGDLYGEILNLQDPKPRLSAPGQWKDLWVWQLMSSSRQLQTKASQLDSKTFLSRGFKQAPDQGLGKLTRMKQDPEEDG